MNISAFAHEASDWLNYWQDLVGALVGAGALLVTVSWTLSRESRRNSKEAAAFRTALGAEIRQFAAATLNGYDWLAESVARAISNDKFTDVFPAQLVHTSRLPEPTVYSRGADKLGTLGEQPAFDTVYFYGQLQILQQSIRQIDTICEPEVQLTAKQVMSIMAVMLNAVSAAIQALPAFKNPAWVDKDAALAGKFDSASRRFEELHSARMQCGNAATP